MPAQHVETHQRQSTHEITGQRQDQTGASGHIMAPDEEDNRDGSGEPRAPKEPGEAFDEQATKEQFFDHCRVDGDLGATGYAERAHDHPDLRVCVEARSMYQQVESAAHNKREDSNPCGYRYVNPGWQPDADR